MKRGASLLIGLLAISGAYADGTDGRLPPRTLHAARVASLESSAAGLDAHPPRGRQAAGVRLVDLKNDVAQEVRATTLFVREQANDARSRNRWLIVLAGFGLVMLQLRRKHKSLPQRRISPYG
jgi:hypothetical protein